jgi:hypothetical protein
VCASIISFVIVLAGLLLFIVPGIILSILFVFVPIIIGSTDKKALDALAHSWMIVSGRKWLFVVKSFMGGLRIVWAYTVFLIVSLSAWLYVSISGLYHDALIVTTIIGVAHVLIAIVWGLRVWALYTVFMYQLFEEFNRTAVISDITLLDLFKKKVKKLAWGGLVVVMLGILGFIAVFSYFGIQNLKSEILVNPQYVQVGNVQFAISASWIPKPAEQNNSYGFSVVSPIDQVMYQYVLVNAIEKEEPLTFNQITTYFMSQLSELDALKKDGTIMDYSQNISEATMMGSNNSTISMPYIRTSTTLFDDALASNIVNTSVMFEKDAFLYEVQSVCMLDYQKMCERNIETVLIHAAFQ